MSPTFIPAMPTLSRSLQLQLKAEIGASVTQEVIGDRLTGVSKFTIVEGVGD